jgi:predicted aspartyl protease
MAAGLEADAVIPTVKVGHVLIVPEVFLNGRGPFRMVVDTGNASSIIRPSVARSLKLTVAYSVEHETIGGLRRAPAAILSEMRVGGVADVSVEVIISEVSQPGVGGVIGQSWLVRHDYRLDYRRRRLVVDGPPPEGPVRVPLRMVDGRPAIGAEVDGRRAELVLDSGTPAVVLYQPAAARSDAVLSTNGQFASAEAGTARIALNGGWQFRMTAYRSNSRLVAAGLLPLSAFPSVHVSNRDGYVVFELPERAGGRH